MVRIWGTCVNGYMFWGTFLSFLYHMCEQLYVHIFDLFQSETSTVWPALNLVNSSLRTSSMVDHKRYLRIDWDFQFDNYHYSPAFYHKCFWNLNIANKFHKNFVGCWSNSLWMLQIGNWQLSHSSLLILLYVVIFPLCSFLCRSIF